MVGWLPSRDEFEVEHNNEAENLVSSLEVAKYEDGDDEVPYVISYKFIFLIQYRHRTSTCTVPLPVRYRFRGVV
jgi:hypothetical protein